MEQRLVSKLGSLRKKIDRIDMQIVKLLEKRYDTAKEIGKLKRKGNISYYDPKREREIVVRLGKKTKLKNNFIKKLFSSIMEYCRNGEKK